MAVTFDAYHESLSGTGVSTFSASFTIGAVSSPAIVGVLSTDLNTITSPTMTWNSVSMTQISATTVNLSGTGFITLFGLVGPATGTHTLAASWTGATRASIAIASFGGVNQAGGATTFLNGNTVSVSANTTATFSVTTIAGDASVAAWCITQTVNAVGPNPTPDWTTSVTGPFQAGQHRLSAGASDSYTMTLNASGNLIGAGVHIAAATPVVFVPSTDLIRPRPALPIHEHQFATFVPPVLGTNLWKFFGYFEPLSEPVRTRAFPTSEQSFATFVPPVLGTNNWLEIVTESRWHQPWSEPIVKVKPRAAHFPFLFYSESQQFPETVTESRWHQPWSEPVRFKPALPAGEQFFFPTEPIFPPASIGWYNWLSEPVRQKLGLTAILQQTLAQSESAQFPESVTEDRWHQDWSLPQRFPVRNPYFEFFAYGSWSPLPNNVVPTFGYYNWLSEPVRIKTGLGPALQQFQAQDPNTIFPETVSFDRWAFPWSEPVRTKPGLLAALQPLISQPIAPTVSFSWYGWLTEPVRIRPQVPAGEQLFLAPENIAQLDLIGWFAGLSEPVRQKQGLATTLQQAYSFGGPPLVSFSWYDWLSEPVRTKARTAFFQDFTYGTWAPIQPPITVSNWFSPFSEPVRFKPGLSMFLQQDLARNTFTPAFVISITATLNALEIDTDTVAFILNQIQGNIASARVSIHEVGQ